MLMREHPGVRLRSGLEFDEVLDAARRGVRASTWDRPFLRCALEGNEAASEPAGAAVPAATEGTQGRTTSTTVPTVPQHSADVSGSVEAGVGQLARRPRSTSTSGFTLMSGGLLVVQRIGRGVARARVAARAGVAGARLVPPPLAPRLAFAKSPASGIAIGRSVRRRRRHPGTERGVGLHRHDRRYGGAQ